MIVVKDFYADWCGPCKMMDPILADVEKELSGKVTFEKINVDEKTDVSSQYGVMSIPTYVIEKDGKEVGRLIGYMAKGDFKKKIEEHVG